ESCTAYTVIAFHQSSETGFGLTQCVFDLLPVGNVADRAGNQHAVFCLLGTEADLQREFCTILANSVQLQAHSHGSKLWMSAVCGAVVTMLVPETLGNQHLDRLAEEFVAMVAEQFLRLRID